VLALLVAVAAVAVPATSAARSPWPALHRPLHIATLAPGAACPVSPRTRVDLGAEGVRMLPGRGPAYPNFVGDVLEFWYPPLPQQQDFYGTGWSGDKVLWWVAGAYRGPVLIRGRQLDGPHLLRFDTGRPLPPAEIRIAAGGGYKPWKGARDRASYTRVEAAGCYAYQIDGTSFSRVIVFEARQVEPPTP